MEGCGKNWLRVREDVTHIQVHRLGITAIFFEEKEDLKRIVFLLFLYNVDLMIFEIVKSNQVVKVHSRRWSDCTFWLAWIRSCDVGSLCECSLVQEVRRDKRRRCSTKTIAIRRSERGPHERRLQMMTGSKVLIEICIVSFQSWSRKCACKWAYHGRWTVAQIVVGSPCNWDDPGLGFVWDLKDAVKHIQNDSDDDDNEWPVLWYLVKGLVLDEWCPSYSPVHYHVDGSSCAWLSG